MDPEEKKRLREKKRIMRRQRKEYLAEERRSIRRQKLMEQTERNLHRKQIRKARLDFFTMKLKSAIRAVFGKHSQHNQLTQHSEPGKSESDLKHKKMRLLKKQRKQFLRDEKSSRKREKREMKQKMARMRRQITTEKIENVKKDLKYFIRHPIKKTEIDETDRRIRKRIRRDIRRRNLEAVYDVPLLIGLSIKRFWQKRFEQVSNISHSLRSFINLLKMAFNLKEARNGFFKTMVNSLIFFLLSFLLVYYVHQFATILTARAFNIPTKLYSYRIDWPLYTYSYLYTRKALIVIFGMGPLLCLLLGFGAYRLFLWSRFRTTHLKTFALWTAFNAFNLFFGAYIVGVITRTGFVYTSEWLFLSNMFDVEEIVLMIVSIVVLLIIGYYATKQFVYASNSPLIIEPKIRFIYILSAVFIPWLVGNLVLFGVNIPKNPFELVLLYSTSALIVIPVFSNYNTTTMQMLKVPYVPKKFRIAWVSIFLVVVFIFVTRIILRSGISFY